MYQHACTHARTRVHSHQVDSQTRKFNSVMFSAKSLFCWIMQQQFVHTDLTYKWETSKIAGALWCCNMCVCRHQICSGHFSVCNDSFKQKSRNSWMLVCLFLAAMEKYLQVSASQMLLLMYCVTKNPVSLRFTVCVRQLKYLEEFLLNGQPWHHFWMMLFVLLLNCVV